MFNFIFTDKRFSWFWLLARLYLGWEWLQAGLEKITNPAWVGNGAGKALGGFIQNALTKTTGPHPDVQDWYAGLLHYFVVPHPAFWSYLVAGGEVLVGVGLILGFLTGISAFFGAFMNLNYLLAGTVSINPTMFTLAIGIMLAWKVAGHIGLDRFFIPYYEKLQAFKTNNK